MPVETKQEERVIIHVGESKFILFTNFAKALNIFDAYTDEEEPFFKSDLEALSSDWAVTAEDFRQAFIKVLNEKRKEETLASKA